MTTTVRNEYLQSLWVRSRDVKELLPIATRDNKYKPYRFASTVGLLLLRLAERSGWASPDTWSQRGMSEQWRDKVRYYVRTYFHQGKARDSHFGSDHLAIRNDDGYLHPWGDWITSVGLTTTWSRLDYPDWLLRLSRKHDGCLDDLSLARTLRHLVGNPFEPPRKHYYYRPVCGYCQGRGCDVTVDSRSGRYQESECRYCQGHGLLSNKPVPWLTPEIFNLAGAIYAEVQPDYSLDPVRLNILADALEESGCTYIALLDALRGKEKCLWCPASAEQQEQCEFCGDTQLLPPIPLWRGFWPVDWVLADERCPRHVKEHDDE